MNYNIYCDGACSGNPGIGGWAYIVVDGDNIIHQESGYELKSTNQRMELMACLKACEYIDRNTDPNAFAQDFYTIHTDSAYLYRCKTERWYTKWRVNGWKNAEKKPVANDDIWKKLIKYFDSGIAFKKVKGHSGDKFNEIVDDLAVEARRRAE